MKRTKDYPKASQCRHGLHDWYTTRSDGFEAFGNTYREDCRKCGQHRIWKIGIGGFSAKWLASHARDALQPWGRDKMMFIEEYGLAAYERFTAKREQMRSAEDITAEAKDALRTSKRTTFI